MNPWGKQLIVVIRLFPIIRNIQEVHAMFEQTRNTSAI